MFQPYFLVLHEIKKNTIIKTTLARYDRRVFTLSGNEVLPHDALGLCFEFPSLHSLLKINRGEVIDFQSTDLKVFCKIYYLVIVAKTRTIVCFTLSSLIFYELLLLYIQLLLFWCISCQYSSTFDMLPRYSLHLSWNTVGKW